MTVRTYQGPLSACGVQKTQNKIFKINDDKILLLSGFFPMHNLLRIYNHPRIRESKEDCMIREQKGKKKVHLCSWLTSSQASKL
jgi:hypothetical protein